MISEGKSNSDVIDELLEMMSKGEKITLSDIDEIISTRSIVDTKASADALTIFYSGEPEGLINTIATGGSDIRMIRRTEAFEFVANDNLEDIVRYAIKCEHKSWTAEQIDTEVTNLFYDTSKYNSSGDLIKSGEGYWTKISRRFAADTKGDAYSLCTNADPTRIYAADELPTWLDVADNSARMGGYTKADLLAMNKTDRFNAIKEWTTKDLKSSKVFYNELGKKIGQTFDGTFLENKAKNIIPHDYKFETTIGDIQQFKSNTELSNICSDFNELSDLEKIQLGQLELDSRNCNTSKMQNAFGQYSSDATSKIKVHYNADGSVAGIDMSGVKGGTAMEKPASSVFETTIGEIRNYKSDADMRVKYPEFDSMTDMDKLIYKVKDNLYTKNADTFKNVNVSENELLDYARKLGKSNALDLTEDEIMLYKAGKLMSTADDVPLGLVDDVSKYKKLSKISDSVNISGLDVFFLVIDAGFVLQDVNRSIWNIDGQTIIEKWFYVILKK